MLNFSNRINGKTYYKRLLLGALPLACLATVAYLYPNDDDALSLVLGLTLIVLFLVYAFFTLSQVRQRANDIGKQPLLIAILAWATPLYLFLGFIPGQQQANKYGPMPR